MYEIARLWIIRIVNRPEPAPAITAKKSSRVRWRSELFLLFSSGNQEEIKKYKSLLVALVTFEWLEWMWIIGASREVDLSRRAVRHHLVIQFIFASSTQFACINNELKATTLRHRHQCAVKVRNFHICILSIHDTLHSRRCRHHRLYVIRQTIKFSANIGAQFTANWFLTSRFPSHHIFKLLQMNMSEYWGENYTQEMHTEMHTFLLFFVSPPFLCRRDWRLWKLKIVHMNIGN